MTSPQPARLFDCLRFQAENHPLPDMLAAKDGGGQWKTYATSDVQTLTRQLSAGLLRTGVSYGDGTLEGRSKVGILSRNRPEWVIVDLAVQQAGGVLVPIYPTINAAELQFVLQDAAVTTVFVDDEVMFRKVAGLRDKLPELKDIFSFAPIAGARSWNELLIDPTPELASQLDGLNRLIQTDELATILYTSGTTGTPKGVMLSHRNILSNVFSSFELFEEIGIQGRRALSFLPLNHAFERTATYCYIYSGASIYYAESMDTIGENLREVKPTVFTTVPRLLEKVYEGILAKGNSLPPVQKKLFFWALGLATRFEINQTQPLAYRLQLALADRLIFSKWREALGGNVRAVITGAAACQVRLLRIFAAAKVIVMEGYGLTETSPVISGNRFVESGRLFGSVGPLLKDVDVRFAEDGEIMVKGPNVMMGYYKRPDLTAEVMTPDGWLRTGDIGMMVDAKFLKITDRKKELFKTSGGKYVAPQPIENKMVESRWIEQMMVVGEGQKFVSALIVPSFAAIRQWFSEENRPYPGDTEVINDESVFKKIKEAVQQYNQHFNPVEQIKKFRLLPKEWTIEGGELTPTLKLKRRVILERYGSLVAGMYA
ncbi:AMP-dependent synthetase/ligase [Tellurirhabdus rosea]|uniref:AMP-dependent synthetase/ligase n=1 Tax=Tellurirhabdus rosea TaxID=2674997 RepID=UPI0022563691|nr:long-chain fatty acid--CoA ligase [Tellurirhabdus rosea]